MGVADTYSLFEHARGGDQGARGALLDSLRARLVLWCASRMSAGMRAKIEAEDMAQDIVLALHKDLDGFVGDGRKPFYAWVFRVAENRIRDAADHFKAAKRQEEEVPRDAQTTPSIAAVRNEEMVRLRAAIERLPEDHRRVVQLRRFEEREFSEIAGELGRTENAVRIVYCRALKGLRDDLASQT